MTTTVTGSSPSPDFKKVANKNDLQKTESKILTSHISKFIFDLYLIKLNESNSNARNHVTKHDTVHVKV